MPSQIPASPTSPRHSSRERKSRIFSREQNDHYVETHWTSERLFQVENFGPPGSLILDPCCGWRRIPLAAIKAGYGAIASDIVDRGNESKETEVVPFRKLDILDIYYEEVYRWWKQARSVVSNPPFNEAPDVARRCFALAEYKVALIFPVRRLNAAHWLEDLPLRRIWLLTPRPSMPSGQHILDGGYVGGGTVDFAWLVLEKGYVGAPELRWLHRDADR